ncbi:hypothetical protein RCH09_003576 [Actimicrobium sp. GrIS 1.19]|nr:hypothetical protein [Actimicrobium sp. GrIS 1.19]
MHWSPSSSTYHNTFQKEQLVVLISALHRCFELQLPLVVVDAGLPHLRGRMGEPKLYAERLFDFPLIGPLNAPR